MHIINETTEWIAVNKPAGVPVFSANEEDSVMARLTEQYPALAKVGKTPRYGLVHRLDKDTSGILLVAKTERALQHLQTQFAERRIKKGYTALVHGAITSNDGTIKAAIGRDPKAGTKRKAVPPTHPLAQKRGFRDAETHFSVIERFDSYTLLIATPITGRPHQIRTHMLFMGHPIAGDPLYGNKQTTPTGLKRLFLHASRLQFTDRDGTTIVLDSDLPAELQQVVEHL